jgi:hypothetical protein
MTIRGETSDLLKDVYLIAHVQAMLDKDALSLAVDWASLRVRAEGVLIREGVSLPKLPDPPSVE